MALIHYNKGSHFSAEDDVLITVIAPGLGIVLVIVYNAMGSYVIPYVIRYVRGKGQEKLNSPKVIPVTVNSNGNNPNLFRRIFYRMIATSIGRQLIHTSDKLIRSTFLRILVSSVLTVVHLIIIGRVGVLSANIARYLMQNRVDVWKITVNTLGWIVYSRERDKMVSFAFVVVTLISAKLWATKNSVIQNPLKIWVLITFLNLSDYIYVKPSFSRLADIGVFGLPKVEHTIKQLNASSEHTISSKISMLGKEEPLDLLLPLQKEMPKDISSDPELGISKWIKNSTLGEEDFVLAKKEGLQKEKINRSKTTSKPKRRMKNLQELEQIPSDVKPLSIENDFAKVDNVTKIRAEKVQ